MSLNRGDLIKKISEASSELLREKGYISFIDILIKIGKLKKEDYEAWRFRRIPYLEKAVTVNLGKVNYLLRTFHENSRRGGLKPIPVNELHGDPDVGLLKKYKHNIQQSPKFHSRVLGLKPSKTVYMSWGKGPKTRLRFSKSGDPNIEEAYSTHFLKSKEVRQDRLREVSGQESGD